MDDGSDGSTRLGVGSSDGIGLSDGTGEGDSDGDAQGTQGEADGSIEPTGDAHGSIETLGLGEAHEPPTRAPHDLPYGVKAPL